MFDQFKERLHHVQQDLSTGLKTLSTKAKEVKLPHRDETPSLKKDIPSAVCQSCNYDAGAELLNRFQQMWGEIHREIEATAEQATVVDTRVQEAFLNYERRAEPLLQLQRQLMDLPRFVENVQLLTASIGKLEAEFEEVESMILGFEDLIGHCDLLRNKHTQTAELARYTQQRLKEQGLMRVRLQEEHDLSIRIMEEAQKADKMERQRAFEDVFTADMEHYKTYGQMQRVLPAEAPNGSAEVGSIDDFRVDVDCREQEALDDFLGEPPRGEAKTREEVGEGMRAGGREELERESEEDEEEAVGPSLETVLEESEEDSDADAREDTSPAAAAAAAAASTVEETDEARSKEHQEEQQENPEDSSRQEEPVRDGYEPATAQETDEDEEFDTPEEGSETEST